LGINLFFWSLSSMAKPPLAERPYESLFICPIDTPQPTLDAFMEKIKAIITKENGVFKALQVWGRRRMTFPVKRHKDGLYIYFDFNAGGGAPAALTSLYRITDFVLRHLTVEREDAPVLPTPEVAAPTTEAGQAAAAAPTPAVAETINKELPSAK
jgi:small subunit ribosomal protein S6